MDVKAKAANIIEVDEVKNTVEDKVGLLVVAVKANMVNDDEDTDIMVDNPLLVIDLVEEEEVDDVIDDDDTDLPKKNHLLTSQRA